MLERPENVWRAFTGQETEKGLKMLSMTDRLDPRTRRGLDDLKTQIRFCARNWTGGYAQNRLASIHVKQWRFQGTPRLGLASGNVYVHPRYRHRGIMSDLVCWMPDELLPELGLIAMVFYTVINPNFAFLLERNGYRNGGASESRHGNLISDVQTWIRPAKNCEIPY